MTIRWKLNLTVAALLGVFLTAVAVVMHTVTRNAEHTQSYSRMRGQSQFVSDLRTDVYQRVAAATGALKLPAEPERVGWPQYLLDDIDVQIRLAANDAERGDWQGVRGAVLALATALESPLPNDEATQAIAALKRHLRSLRHTYDLLEQDSIAVLATGSFHAQVAVSVASVVTILLFLVYLTMVRKWLVSPINVLKESADAIGEGKLDHRVPLEGADELAGLARRLDAMAARLARHQAELLEARELTAIGELCTNVAHGLRNPLAGIRAGAQLAGRRAVGVEKVQALINDLVGEVDRMDARIVRLFEFSKPCELHRECLTFSELAGAIEADSRPLLQAKQVELAVEDETNSTTWCVDREQLAAALTELTANAVHHSEPGGKVTVRGESVVGLNGEKSCLRVEVIDRGAGMSAITREKAFDLFFTGRPGGTGMGLAMVRRTVEKHNGQVAVESEPGKGTTVTVTLPSACPLPDDADTRRHCRTEQSLKRHLERNTKG